MKKVKFLVVLLALVAMALGLCACDLSPAKPDYDLSLNEERSFVLEVGAEVDFTQFFTVKDRNGNQIVIDEEMLDLSEVNTAEPGTFDVTLTVGGQSITATFTVVQKAEPEYDLSLDEDYSFVLEVGAEVDFTLYFIVRDGNGDRIPVEEEMLDLSEVNTAVPGTFDVTLWVGGQSITATFTVVQKAGPDHPNPDQPTDPSAVFGPYADRSTWNFAVTVTDEAYDIEDYYEYDGNRILNSYTGYDWEGSYADYTDYLAYDEAADLYTYYSDNGDGTYEVFDGESDEFWEYYFYCYLVDLTHLADFSFTVSGNVYTAVSPSEVGNAVLGEYESLSWTSVTVTVTNGKIMKIVGQMDDGDTVQYTFSDHGNVRVTLPDTAGEEPSTPTVPTDTMGKQTYDPNTFDSENLQDKMMKTDGAIGLPSTGDYHALVIPVQFRGDTVTQAQLNNLEIAFNGTEEQTGWESVKTYYQKASYGKLNLTFDIQNVYQAKNNASYYESYQKNTTLDGEAYTITGEEVILTEALAYYEGRIDLTQYDTNGDGVIDAVYLIYSAPVDYEEQDFYWAYVTWYYGSNTYGGLDAFYYLFAGFDFMKEKTPGGNANYGTLPGMKINAETYIHESGHLLGLDDYYDYEENQGSNEGLGGADMMDYNIGDHGVYSKIMLGWLTPTIVNESRTVTIGCSATSASAILIPLNFDNSYFCEYLLIDLYAATGLNRMHASDLYGGAEYGVRIYHVSSSINDPYNNSFRSFTDNNNSTSKYALIKLVEADGERKFASSGGSAARTDLWRAGQTLSQVFPSYTRNDGKKLNFDVSVGAVSATSATVTVTFSA